MVEEYPTEFDIAEAEMQQEESMEDQMDLQGDVQEMYTDTSPAFVGKDDLYSLFWKVIRLQDSSKIGNLNNEELGKIPLTVRDCQHIALIGMTLRRPGFANFYRALGEITLSTSASKKGWLQELFVSQRKMSTRAREIKSEQLQATQPKKKRRFLR